MTPLAGTSWALLVLVLAAALYAVARRTVAGRQAQDVPLSTYVMTLAGLLLTSLGLLLHLGPPAPDWSGRAEDGGLASWSGVHSARPEAVRVMPLASEGAGPSAALAFTVRRGDHTFGQEDSDRAEVVASPEQSGALEGADEWYRWAFQFPELPRVTGEGNFYSTTQWHQDSEGCPPNLALVVREDPAPRLALAVRGGDLDEESCDPGFRQVYDLGPLRAGVWSDVLLHVRWSADQRRGRVELWRDGRQVVQDQVANLYTGQGAYLKQGIYRSSRSDTSTLLITGAVRGSEAAVGAPCPSNPLAALWRRGAAWCSSSPADALAR